MRLFPAFVAEGAVEYGGMVRVLPPEVAHRIAAGEVIERPASAVKELVENSLDAGAGWVEVEIEDGGMALIRVRDDGSGMASEDAERAITEHATSKIRTAVDLASVVSLGFRGEALHAIGAVSHLTLTTRKRGAADPLGTRVRVSAGEMVESATAAHSSGTTVEARNLFFNLPVRRGFLGTVRSDAVSVATTEPVGATHSRERVIANFALTGFQEVGRSGEKSWLLQVRPSLAYNYPKRELGRQGATPRARHASTGAKEHRRQPRIGGRIPRYVRLRASA
jgi:Histidine kinase-, DNA gyrase B-, and HSP90-like ATPase